MKFHAKMVLGLKGIIQDGVTVEDFSAVTSLPESDCESILDMLTKNNFCTFENSFYYFESGAKLKIVLSMLENGFPIDEISESLDWKNTIIQKFCCDQKHDVDKTSNGN